MQNIFFAVASEAIWRIFWREEGGGVWLIWNDDKEKKRMMVLVMSSYVLIDIDKAIINRFLRQQSLIAVLLESDGLRHVRKIVAITNPDVQMSNFWWFVSKRRVTPNDRLNSKTDDLHISPHQAKVRRRKGQVMKFDIDSRRDAL